METPDIIAKARRRITQAPATDWAAAEVLPLVEAGERLQARVRELEAQLRLVRVTMPPASMPAPVILIPAATPPPGSPPIVY